MYTLFFHLFVARIDIAGGWTDTPPQAYEWGGVVVTLAIKINNEVYDACKDISTQLLNHIICVCLETD